MIRKQVTRPLTWLRAWLTAPVGEARAGRTGDLVREARLKANMTQDRLARAAGITERTVRRVEANGAMSLETAAAIASVLRTTFPRSTSKPRWHVLARNAGIITAVVLATPAFLAYVGSRHDATRKTRMLLALAAFPAVAMEAHSLQIAWTNEATARLPFTVMQALALATLLMIAAGLIFRVATSNAGTTKGVCAAVAAAVCLMMSAVPPADVVQGLRVDEARTIGTVRTWSRTAAMITDRKKAEPSWDAGHEERLAMLALVEAVGMPMPTRLTSDDAYARAKRRSDLCMAMPRPAIGACLSDPAITATEAGAQAEPVTWITDVVLRKTRGGFRRDRLAP